MASTTWSAKMWRRSIWNSEVTQRIKSTSCQSLGESPRPVGVLFRANICVSDSLIAKLLQEHRQSSGSYTSPSRTMSHSSKPSIDRKESASYGSPKKADTAIGYAPGTVAAPPPYTSTASSPSITKKAPPPPPLKPKPSYNAAKYCTAIFDFEAQVSPAMKIRLLNVLMRLGRRRPLIQCRE